MGLRKPRLSGEIRKRKWIDVGWSEGKIKPRTIGVVTPVDLSDPLKGSEDRPRPSVLYGKARKISNDPASIDTGIDILARSS